EGRIVGPARIETTNLDPMSWAVEWIDKEFFLIDQEHAPRSHLWDTTRSGVPFMVWVLRGDARLVFSRIVRRVVQRHSNHMTVWTFGEEISLDDSAHPLEGSERQYRRSASNFSSRKGLAEYRGVGLLIKPQIINGGALKTFSTLRVRPQVDSRNIATDMLH